MLAAYQNVPLLPIQDLMQPSAPQEVHHLPLLMRLHASKDHHILHDDLQQAHICLLQQMGKGKTRDTALRLALCHKSQCL